MPNYVRTYVPGATYFFTVVTAARQPALVRPDVRDALRRAFKATSARWPFSMEACVLLPDHLHCLWRMPEADADFSRRWSTIKRLTTQSIGTSIWQPRFWEHVIRNERDYERHFDYVHWNPVKHGYSRSAAEWPYSTFRRFVARGVYPPDWATSVDDLGIE
ncbi:MAG TPA: transposase [Verrucomicrobiae bacterium]|nr:transposase [Verrucomicrobiae bacterium]